MRRAEAEEAEGHSRQREQHGTRGILGPADKTGKLAEGRLGDIQGRAWAIRVHPEDRREAVEGFSGAEERVKRCLPLLLSFPAATIPPVCAFKARLPL